MSDRPLLLNEPHFVYRLFDADGVLLYVGCTCRPVHRMSAHRRDKRWAGRLASVTWSEPMRQFQALAAEAKAIREEAPEFNIVGNPHALPVEVRHPEWIVAVPALDVA